MFRITITLLMLTVLLQVLFFASMNDSVNSPILAQQDEYSFITKWGSETPGTGDGQFINPVGLATDSSDNIYVADRGNNRIQKFDSDGNFITKWGTPGTDDGQFNSPASLAIDSSGNVLVADEGNNRIQKFDSDGNFITQWGTPGIGDGQFEEPTGIAVDSLDNVYVVDRGNSRIQVFASQ
jgi:tripartite motif-containing protein 71